MKLELTLSIVLYDYKTDAKFPNYNFRIVLVPENLKLCSLPKT